MATNDPLQTQMGSTRLAGLGADDYGKSDHRRPLVLLHGLTFDRTMWGPAIDELGRVDPDRRVIALDLPGHAESSPLPSYAIEAVVDAVHAAVEEAGLEAPVIVGHSLAAIVATVYATRHPVSGVVNVDQSLQTAPFAEMLRSFADKLRGPGFPAVWEMFAASMHIELLPAEAQTLLRSTTRPRQDLVLGYWNEVLEQPSEDLAHRMAAGQAALLASGLPYLIVAGAEVEPAYRAWLHNVLPQATITVFEDGGHFPHLAEPDRFAQCLATTADWTPKPLPPGVGEEVRQT